MTFLHVFLKNTFCIFHEPGIKVIQEHNLSNAPVASDKNAAWCEDQKAVRTVVMACIWDISCICVYSSLFFLLEQPATSAISSDLLLLGQGTGRCISALSVSVNLFFYLRAKTFSKVFKETWFARWQAFSS